MKESSFARTLKVLGFETYDDYCKSDFWKNKKAEYSRSDRPKFCLKCQRPKYVLHHLTYARLGCEDLDDLMALCNDCHFALHERMKRTNTWAYHPHAAIKLLSKEYRSKRAAQKVVTAENQSEAFASVVRSFDGLSHEELKLLSGVLSARLAAKNSEMIIDRHKRRPAKKQRVKAYRVTQNVRLAAEEIGTVDREYRERLEREA